MSRSPDADLRASVGSDGIPADQYRSAMRHYPAGVTIVTLAGADGPVGFTATSFASLSLEPPLISFNIAHTSSSIAAMLGADSLVVHFLGEHQQELARRFSREAGQRFSEPDLWTTLETGEPVLHGTPLWVRATVRERFAVGDHTLVVGLVTRVHDDTGSAPLAAPLLYYNGAYHRATALD